MKFSRLLIGVIALLVALVPLGANRASAASYTVNGILDSADPIMPNVA